MSSGDRDGEKTVRFLAGNALWLINARAGIDRAAAVRSVHNGIELALRQVYFNCPQ